MTLLQIREKNEKKAKQVKKLSKTHTPSEIARMTGLNYTQVTNIQINPKYKIKNPKRAKAYNVFRRDRSGVPEGCFDINKMPAFNF